MSSETFTGTIATNIPTSSAAQFLPADGAGTAMVIRGAPARDEEDTSLDA
jgi:hypothetical protein